MVLPSCHWLVALASKDHPMEDTDSQPDSNPDETRVASTKSDLTEDTPGSDSDDMPLSRRTTLVSLIGLGGLGLASTPAAGKKVKTWKKDRDAQGNKLLNLGALAMANNSTEITDFAGPNLGVANGRLSAAQWNKDVDAGGNDLTNLGMANASKVNTDNLSDNSGGDVVLGTRLDAAGNTLRRVGRLAMLKDNTRIASFTGDNLSVDSNDVLNADVSAANNWNDTDGDSLLEPNSGFEGIDLTGKSNGRVETPTVRSASGTPLTLETDAGTRALKLGVPDTDDSVDKETAGANFVAGHPDNSAKDAVGATVAGGGSSGDKFNQETGNTRDNTNEVLFNYGTVGGGQNNRAGSEDDGDPASPPPAHATVGGGLFNTASGQYTTVAGGAFNIASARLATVAGGSSNKANENRTTIGGGVGNVASGFNATIPGGRNSKAAERDTFVWNDGTLYHDFDGDGFDDGLSSSKAVAGEPVTGLATFSVSASGGVRFITGNNSVTYIESGSTGWASMSTRTAKTNIDPIDSQEVLAGVEEMEVSTWEYKDEDGEGQGTRHIGPMAEEFHEAVDVGTSDEHINSINADGVAFAAIQGLSQQLDQKDDRIDDQRDRIDRLETSVENKEDRIDELEAENEQLRERLRAVENRLNEMEGGQSSPAAADD